MSTLYDYSPVEEEQHLIVVIGKDRVNFKWQEQDISLKKSQSVQYLVELLLHPYQKISAVALHALVNYELPRYTKTDEPSLRPLQMNDSFHSLLPEHLSDRQTVQSIKNRLNQLIEQISEATAWNDLARLDELKSEQEELTDYLKAAIAQHYTETVCRDLDSKCNDNVYHLLRHILRMITNKSPRLGKLLSSCLNLWAELMFIPADNLSVIVMESEKQL